MYNEFYPVVDVSHIRETFRELSFLYTALEELHAVTENDLVLPDLEVFFWTKYPTADKDTYGAFFNALRENQISPDAGKAILQDVQRRRAALKVSEISYRISTGTATHADLKEHLDVLEGKVDPNNRDDLAPLTTNLEELVTDVYQRPGFRWRLNALNVSLGSLRPGDFGFIFARPETGKTTFLASEVSYMLQQGATVCWFNNEEQGQKVIIRVYQAYFGVHMEQLLANVKRYHEQFREETGGRLKFYDSAQLDRGTVERIVKRESPTLVIYDQIDKVKGFTEDRDDLKLGAIYQWARELAKNSHAVIGVCQASGMAEGIRYLQMDHVANAKTSKQAEGDWILGIGKIHDPGAEKTRYLNICKNKLFGDQGVSNPDLKHGRFEVLIEPHIARYRDIIDYN